MKGATATEDGKAGLVPAPMAGDEGKLLDGSGSWHGTKEILVDADTMEVDEQDEAIVIGTRMKDSPSDGVTYGRKAGRWVPVNTQIDLIEKNNYLYNLKTSNTMSRYDVDSGKYEDISLSSSIGTGNPSRYFSLSRGIVALYYGTGYEYWDFISYEGEVTRHNTSRIANHGYAVECNGALFISTYVYDRIDKKARILKYEGLNDAYEVVHEVTTSSVSEGNTDICYMYVDGGNVYAVELHGSSKTAAILLYEWDLRSFRTLVTTPAEVIAVSTYNGYLLCPTPEKLYLYNLATLSLREIELTGVGGIRVRSSCGRFFVSTTCDIVKLNDDMTSVSVSTARHVEDGNAIVVGVFDDDRMYYIDAHDKTYSIGAFSKSDISKSENLGTYTAFTEPAWINVIGQFERSRQAQGDWDVNDETSPAFIRNKPVLDGWSAPVAIAPIPKYASYVGTNALYAKYNPALKLLMLYGYVQFTSGFTPAYSASDGGGSSDWPMVFTCQLPGVTTSASGFFQLDISQATGGISYKTLEVVLRASGKLEVMFSKSSIAAGWHNVINSMIA